MKFYNSSASSPRVVTMFMVAEGLETERVKADRRAANRKNLNLAGRTPAHKLDDGMMAGSSVTPH